MVSKSFKWELIMVIFASTSCGHEYTDDDGNQEWYDEGGNRVIPEEPLTEEPENDD
jgi:hypothetical protein